MSTRPIGDLKADAENPRTIDEAALAGLGVSLEDFGDLSGIVFNKRTGDAAVLRWEAFTQRKAERQPA